MSVILVCMPTYHSPSDWILRAVNSLKAQTYPKFDCWIVKDGCNLGCDFYSRFCDRTCLECEQCKQTADLCMRIVQEDSRFSFHAMPIRFSGAGWGPRNYAIMNTKHELIAYLDDDNWYEPDHLESLYNVIGDNDMAYTGTQLWHPDSSKAWTRIHNAEPAQGFIDTSEMLHKRSLIDKYGGWRYVKKGNDWDIVQRWLPGLKWAHTNKITLNFYLREGCGIHRS